MRLTIDVQPRDLNEWAANAEADLAISSTTGMKKAIAKTKTVLRREVRQAFKRTPPTAKAQGQDYLKSFNSWHFPNRRGKFSVNAAGVLIAKADYAAVFETGGEIRPNRRKYLAITLPTALKLGLERGMNHNSRLAKFSQTEAARRRFGTKLRMIRIPGGKALLGLDRDDARAAGMKVPKAQGFVGLFLLVRAVQAPVKLRMLRLQRKAVELYDQEFTKELNRLRSRRRGRSSRNGNP